MAKDDPAAQSDAEKEEKKKKQEDWAKGEKELQERQTVALEGMAASLNQIANSVIQIEQKLAPEIGGSPPGVQLPA